MGSERDKKDAKLRQINLRISQDYYAEIEEAAELLGLDVAQLVRMIVRENFPTYRERAEEVRRRSAKNPGG